MISILNIIFITNILTNHEDCDLFDYIPIDSDHCPHADYLANLKVCHDANDNELCFSKGNCGVKKNKNNCLYPERDAHTYDIYVKRSKYRQLDYWETISRPYKNIAYKDPISYCSDNYLIHETDMDNPVFEDNVKYPFKTLGQCQNECLNTALDPKKRRCEGYGWRTNGISHTETTLNECKYFYKCEIETAYVSSEVSIKQLGAYNNKDIHLCKPYYDKCDDTWCGYLCACRFNGEYFGLYWDEEDGIIISADKSWCPQAEDWELFNTNWAITKGYFYNNKTLIPNTITSTTQTTTLKTKKTKTKTTTSKTTTSKTKTTKTKTTKTKTTKTNTLSTNTLSTISTKISKKIPNLMTKTTTSYTSYKNSKESSKTEKSINIVLIIFGMFGIIAVTLLIIIYFRGTNKNQPIPPNNGTTNNHSYNNSLYEHNDNDNDTTEGSMYGHVSDISDVTDVTNC